MGCDAFANPETGKFVVEIRDYKTSEIRQTVVLFFPIDIGGSGHPIAMEIIEGDER